MKLPLILALVAALCAAPLFAQNAAPATAVKNVTVDEAEKLLKENKQIVVLDVRTADEFKAGHIAGAKNIDIMSDDFAKQIGALDKDRTYLVHCAAGGRSARACKALDGQQFKSLLHMNQGFSAWEKAGKPVEK
jgi:rhodanese-related sulfurtransferase